ncbi:hypothetical protein G7B40_018220 [Aetokthonos hydrillicola Thurmond2011]|jgi:hypothetical protein|uniref:Uncharacterized protein n=1 Tax=Aetokthonos hydrillicola Thurmond2011 TaxID=2712845 RepID=A0AAP5M612_9CYAN|nr:hypothetical protein [Aetokthonos hydrillicola]MBO3460363.1 hypothetical protein [Aetokthonos hydrillicola CCALA 1050]MBW4588371.1 hypothetical protein [Aetokthonos hydrillicola CCALA 1050]MDR9896481.1 hypothetical protein [Aetokthonos hydrillicola Thurmond2011]
MGGRRFYLSAILPNKQRSPGGDRLSKSALIFQTMLRNINLGEANWGVDFPLPILLLCCRQAAHRHKFKVRYSFAITQP